MMFGSGEEVVSLCVHEVPRNMCQSVSKSPQRHFDASRFRITERKEPSWSIGCCSETRSGKGALKQGVSLRHTNKNYSLRILDSWNPDKHSLEEILLSLILIGFETMRKVETQLHGLVIVADIKGFSFKQARQVSPSLIRKYVDIILVKKYLEKYL
jgi:hypothetical protein